jgi:hypothetical protein
MSFNGLPRGGTGFYQEISNTSGVQVTFGAMKFTWYVTFRGQKTRELALDLPTQPQVADEMSTVSHQIETL